MSEINVWLACAKPTKNKSTKLLNKLRIIVLGPDSLFGFCSLLAHARSPLNALRH